MAKKRTAQRPSLASLVFLAGAASGTSLSLSNFQSLTSSVSVQCLYAYNLPIRGCSLSDFTGGATCSESCVAGLQAVQFSVQGLCTNINAAPNSLIVEVKEGHILDVLCKTDAKPRSTTLTPTPPPTKTPPPPPTKTPPPPQTSSEPKKTTSTTSTTSIQVSTTSSVPSTTTTVTTTVTTAVTSATPTTLTSVIIPSSTSESTTTAAEAATSQAANNEQPTFTSEEQPKPTRKPNTQPGSGGGSPFDFVASSKGTGFGLTRAFIATAIAITFTTLTLI